MTMKWLGEMMIASSLKRKTFAKLWLSKDSGCNSLKNGMDLVIDSTQQYPRNLQTVQQLHSAIFVSKLLRKPKV